MHVMQGSNADRLVPVNVLNGHLERVGNANRGRQDDMTLIKNLFEYRNYRRTVRDLNRLSNEQLADLGIPRWRVHEVARGGQIDPAQVV